MQRQPKTIEGLYSGHGLRIAIVASRFNDFIVDKLISGALDSLQRHGVSGEEITLVRVPGAFELPLATKRLARGKEYQGIICLGSVIRGATPHFDYIAAETSKGLAQVALDLEVPIGFGILTTDTLEQAIERAGSKAGNKGAEAAQSVLEMTQVLNQL
jgi:6,7-dimethyl-8-ribityllumazine synthase